MNEEKNKLSIESKKQTVMMALIAIVTLLLVVIGATYAFFASQNTGKKDTNINAESGTTDVLTFENGDNIKITANMKNFASGMTSITQTTNPKATLRANDATKKAEEEYNVYLVIDENGLIYTNKETKTPELLLKVTRPDGTEIKDIPGLKYYENVDGQEGVSGFDITNKKNAFAIYEGYKISVGEEDDGVKVDTWEVTVTLVNFKTGNQNDNTGRNFHGRIVMTKGTEDAYKLAHINTVSTEKTADSITATLDITDGTKAITEYWFGIESKGEVVAASEEEFNDYHQSETGATYTFNGLADNTNYVIHSYVVDEEGFKSNVYETDIVATNKLPKILTATATATSYDTIEVKVTGTEDGTNPIRNYRYQIETNDEIIENKTVTKAETTHTFTDLAELTQYKIIINAIDSQNRESTNYEIDVTTLSKTIGIICQNQELGQCIKNNYKLDNTLIYHNAEAIADSEMVNKDLIANDDSYRFSGGYKIADNYKEKYNKIADELIKRTCNGQDINVDDDFLDYEKCYNKDVNDISKYYLAYEGKNTLYGTYYEAFQKAVSEHYIEEAVKNYVCLDGTETTNGACTSDADLYRIIGFFPNETGEYEIKLIKYDYATKDELGDKTTADGGAYYGKYYFGSTDYQGNPDNLTNIAGYYWNSSQGIGSNNPNTNMWQYSNLNKINLNQFYYNYITNKVSDLDDHIMGHTWTTGGLEYNAISTTKQVYDKELGSEKLTTSDKKCYPENNRIIVQTCTEDDLTHKNAKIGLMYISDYGYAAYPEAWNQYPSGYSSVTVTTNNWMYMGLNEWTISRSSSSGSNALDVLATGSASGISSVSSSYGVRPSFYLDSSTKIKSGNGSKTNPFRLSWN